MPPMSDINAIFEELAATSGKNDKLAILARNKDNDLFKEVCRLALDPFTLFYIKKIPVYTPDGMKEDGLSFADLAWGIASLSGLSNRQFTGNAAISHLTRILELVSADDAKVIERIILKDLRCGVDTAVNKVWPNLVIDYPCMLATAYDQKLVDKFQFPAMVQCKLDGMRFNAIVNNGTCEFRSRQGKPIEIADPSFATFFVDMADGKNVVYDGELLCRTESGTIMDRKTGNGIINKAVKGTQSLAEGRSVCAVLWDRIPLEDFSKGVCNVAYSNRLAALIANVNSTGPQFRVEVVYSELVASIEEAQTIFERLLGEGQEGIILKNPKMVWKDARSKDQIKFKAELDCDLKVIEWVEGTGKYVGMMGKLVCATSDGKVVAGVGTGFSDAERATIKPDVVGKIVAVVYNARVSDKNRPDVDSLFLPRFIEIREDKTVADSSAKIK